jgi:hypothetical protein
MILNLCYMAPPRTNVGDRLAHPTDYFVWDDPVVKQSLLAPVAEDVRAARMLIIGGGGIVRHPARNDWQQLRRVVDMAPISTPVVIWGMGINDQGRLDTTYDDCLRYLEGRDNVLIGLRDVMYSNCVPCVSCMRRELDEKYKIERRVGLYSHEAYEVPLDIPRMSNRFEGDPYTYFREVIQFLGSSEIIITNSYHGAYWATLLGRKVIVTQVFSNKFLGLPFQPMIVQDPRNCERSVDYLDEHAKRYDEALSESRERNRVFKKRIDEFCGELRGTVKSC